MNRFAELLDRLSYEPGRNNKLRLMTDYFRHTPDPERGFALAALTGSLSFQYAKPGLIRTLIGERADPVLFGLSYDYVGDLSETVALMWPTLPEQKPNYIPTLSEVVTTLSTLGKSQLPAQLARWLDALDETGRWALLKLVTGGLRIGVSARLAKTAAAALGEKDVTEIELLWAGFDAALCRTVRLAGRPQRTARRSAIRRRFARRCWRMRSRTPISLRSTPRTSWRNGNGTASAFRRSPARSTGERAIRLYSRTGEDISKSFPDLVDALRIDGAIDGELLILRDGRVQSFNVLQQRLNRKTVTPKLLAEFPAHLRAYDLLADGMEDLRDLPFAERRKRLEAFVTKLADPRIDLSPTIAFKTWDELKAARADPSSAGAGHDSDAVEGVMLKRRNSTYVPGRPKGPWWKWKRDPFTVDAVLMYAQRGHGKRSSYYSDYTFGVWKESKDGDELVPVGKAYFGFTDEELLEIDRFVRRNTIDKFGPVREVTHEPDEGLVFEVAFEGLARSTRHKSGLAMRFPRISRLRWDKPPKEADRIEALEKILQGIESGRASPLIATRKARA